MSVLLTTVAPKRQQTPHRIDKLTRRIHRASIELFLFGHFHKQLQKVQQKKQSHKHYNPEIQFIYNIILPHVNDAQT